jgi:hypothetical protein
MQTEADIRGNLSVLFQNHMGNQALRWEDVADKYIERRFFYKEIDETSGTLANQNYLVQRRMKIHFDDIKHLDDVELKTAPTEFQKILNKIGLSGQKISCSTFLQCVDDLKLLHTEKIEKKLGDILIAAAYPESFTFNNDAVDVVEQAQRFEFEIVDVPFSIKPSTYTGEVVAVDNHKLLLNTHKNKVIIIYYWELPRIFERGKTISVKFLEDRIIQVRF